MLTHKDPQRDQGRASADATSVSPVALMSLVGLLSLGIFAITVLTGGVGDYSMYIVHWASQANTGEPWPVEYRGTSVAPNAYGPMHAVFGMLFQVNWLLPKLITSGAIIFLFAVLAWDSLQAGNLTWRKVILGLAILALSPLVIFTNYVQGMNDSIPALCLGLACLARRERWFLLAGLLLGVGALLKFYPLLFAPFFAIDKDRTLRVGVLLVAAGIFIAGMALGVVIWGESALSPFTFGIEREAKSLSIAKLFEETLCANGLSGVCSITTGMNMYLVLLTASALALVAWVSDMDWELSLAVSLPLIFYAYKVGHNQFLETWLAVLLFILMQARTDLRSTILKAAIPMMVFLSVLKTGYILTGGLDGGGWGNDLDFVGQYMAAAWALLLAYFIWRLREYLFGYSWKMPKLAF